MGEEGTGGDRREEERRGGIVMNACTYIAQNLMIVLDG
jgi:hypothetical protein